MTEAVELSQNTQSVLAILVRRHLEQEKLLATEIENFNKRMRELLEKAGIRGPNEEQVAEIEQGSEKLRAVSGAVSKARTSLIGRIHRETGRTIESLGEFIALLPTDKAQDLNLLRIDVRDRAAAAQSEFMDNQISLYYSQDFHRRYLGGVLRTCTGESQANEKSYSNDGKAKETQKGNLLKRAC